MIILKIFFELFKKWNILYFISIVFIILFISIFNGYFKDDNSMIPNRLVFSEKIPEDENFFGKHAFLSKQNRLQINSFKNLRPDFTIDISATFPYVSGSTLLLYSDSVYDNFIQDLEAKHVKAGDIIFVKCDYMEKFFHEIYPYVKSPFILITHNGDCPISIKYAAYLNDSKVHVWFGQNPDFIHPKLIPTPIGLENSNWYPHKINLIRNVKINKLKPWNERKYILYINFNTNTHKSRSDMVKYFKNFSNVIFSGRVDYQTYLSHLENSKYVLCPRVCLKKNLYFNSAKNLVFG